MNDRRKTKTQLIEELQQARQSLAELSVAATQYRPTAEVIEQRKRAEAALLESEQHFRVAQDLSLDAFTILRSVRNPQGQIIDFEWAYANPAAGRILKQSPEKLIGQRLLDLLPDNRNNQALFDRYVRIVESGQGDEVELEYRSESINGWFRNLAVKLDDGIAVSFSDITRRKQMEEALQHSEQQYAALFAQMLSGCSLQEIICDEQGRPIDYVTLDVNPEFERLLGIPKAAVVGTHASDFLPPAELESWLNVFGPVTLTGVPARYHNYSPLNHKTFEGVVFCPQPGQFAVMFEDVTDRQRTGDALRESEKRFSSAFEFAAIGMALLSTTGAFFKVNQALCTMLKYTAEELTALTIQTITHPADLAQDADQVQQLLAGTLANYQAEKRYLSKPGAWVWGLFNVSLVRDNQNHPQYFIAQIQDITQRKQAETGRQALLEIMHGAVVTHNLPDFLHLVHQAIAKVLYAENFFVILYNPDTGLFEEVYSVDKFDPPAAPDRLEGSISAYVFRTGQPLLLDKARFAELAAQGAAKLVGTDSTSWLGVPLKTADTTIGVMVVQDYDQPDRYSERDTEFLASIAGQVALTVERRRAEEALRRSQQLLAETERLGHVGGWEFNIDTQRQIWTEEVYRIHEVALTFQPTVSAGINFYTPASRPIVEQAVQRAVEFGEPFDLVLEIITAKGNQRWVQAIGQADFEHRRIFGFFQDVTARKQAEDALRDLSRYNRSLLEASLDPLVTIDRAGHIADVNAATEHSTGYSRQELIGTDFSNYFTDPARAQAGYEQVFRDGQVRDYELELRHRAGTITAVLYNASVYRDEAGQVLGVFAAARDITDRKRAQEALHLSEARYHSLIDTQTEMIARSDLFGHLTFVNAAYCQLFGKSPAELLDNSFALTVLPEDLPISLEAVKAIQSSPYRTITETRHVTPHGIRWVEWDNSAVLDEQHNIIELQGTGRDITERKRAEAALRESELLYQSLVAVSPLSICRKDLAGRFTFANRRFLEASHHSLADLIGLTDFDLHAPELAEKYRQDDRRVMETGQALEFIEERAILGGESTIIQSYKTPIFDGAGKVVGVQISFWDITERQRAAEALRASEERFRQVLEILPVGVFLVDKTGRITQSNPAGQQIWAGPQPASLDQFGEYTAWWAATGERIKPDEWGTSRAIATGEISLEEEIEIECLDGTHKIILNSAVPLMKADQTIEGAVAVNQDITDRKRGERAEREARQLAEALRDTAIALNRSLDLAAVFDQVLVSIQRVVPHDGAKITLVTGDVAEVARVSGRCAVEAIGVEQHTISTTYNLRTMQATGEPCILPDTRNNPDWHGLPGDEWIASYAGVPIQVQDELIGYLGLCSAQAGHFTSEYGQRLKTFAAQAALAIQNARLHHRILRYTDQLEERVRERTAALQAANLRLTELDHLKDEFLSRISHELRTPLAGILITLELLETAQPEKRERYMQRLRQAAERLREMIEEVLLFSQLNLYTQPAVLEPIDLNTLIEGRLTTWQTLSAAHHLVFQLDLARDLPRVRADNELVTQAVTRLVTNAVNYTPVGSVIVSTARVDEDNQPWVTVRVKDTGPGITPEELPHIFERFYRGRAAADYKTSGTGVGLSISREIAEKLGGRLTVDTEVGVGSTFILWLPAAG